MKSRARALFNLLKETWKTDMIGGLSKELRDAMNVRLYFGMFLMIMINMNNWEQDDSVRKDGLGPAKRYNEMIENEDDVDYLTISFERR